jgi:hypothetical protein
MEEKGSCRHEKFRCVRAEENRYHQELQKTRGTFYPGDSVPLYLDKKSETLKSNPAMK